MEAPRQKRLLNLEPLESRQLLTVFSPSLLKDISPGVDSSQFSNFLPAGEQLLFNADVDDLWITDGTSEGTVQLGDGIIINPTQAASDDNGVVTFHTRFEEWRTDGTPEGTQEIPDPTNNGRLAVIGGETYGIEWVAGESWLFRIDDDSNQELLFRLPNFAIETKVREINGKLAFFVEAGPGDFNRRTPWISDLTEEGTVPLTDAPIEPVRVSSDDGPPSFFPVEWLANLNDVLLFGNRSSVYRTDGTAEGTELFYEGGYVTEFQGQHYLNAGSTLVTTDGLEIRTLDGEIYDQTQSFSTGAEVYFIQDGAIWRRNSPLFENPEERILERLIGTEFVAVVTSSNTSLFGPGSTSVSNGQDTYRITNAGSEFFLIDQQSTLRGSASLATVEVPWQLIGAPSSPPSNRFSFVGAESKPIDSPFLFRGVGFWAIDGSNMELLDFGGDFGEFLQNDLGNFFLVGESSELWVTDGTSETVVELPIAATPVSFVSWQNKTLLIARTEAEGEELWVIDGSYAETPYEGLRAEVGNFTLEDAGTVTLDVEVSSTEQLSYAWDLNGDGVFEDATTQSPTLDTQRLEDLGIEANRLHRIAVRVDTAFEESIVESGTLLWDVESLITFEGDFDGDRDVDFTDFLILSANFGNTDATLAEGDSDGDGEVTFADFLILSSNFGKTLD